MSTSTLAPYDGQEKVVIAFDLGTTHSAVAFAHLYPGLPPVVRVVTRWPGQEEAGSDSKTPSLVCYDDKTPIAFGAEALAESTDENFLAKWFKLHLHPDSMKSAEPPAYDAPSSATSREFTIPPLPPGVNLTTVYSDFMKYLYNHTVEFFKTSTVDGVRIWERIGKDVVIVLATPNGWDVAQQGFLRDAAVQSGMLPRGFKEDRLHFITEGEASVHYILHYSPAASWLTDGSVFAVLDAGGATIDITLYEATRVTPSLSLREVCGSECLQAGSVFVDLQAEKMLRRKLANSRFGADEFIQEIMNQFERKTKRKFDGSPSASVIRFGRDSENDRAVGITKGRISLTTSDVEQSFDACIPRIVAACRSLLSRGNGKAEHLLLVGGFGESPYLRKMLQAFLGADGLTVVTVEQATKKAAAEGAALWYTTHLVDARAVRSAFGNIPNVPYEPTIPAHHARERSVFTGADGGKWIPGSWYPWISKHDVVEEDTEKTFEYNRTWRTRPEAIRNLSGFRQDVYAYDGDGESPLFAKNMEAELLPQFRHVCHLTADLSGLIPSLTQQTGADGKVYWIVHYSVLVFFGGTSMRARLEWMEGSQKCQGPIAIIPNSIEVG